ncbi:hypothetical protein [uncultured Desulfovibrio sp.]|uniref:hypothetical protein n=1 Tax=uncultured Desulfovibrio sp. TaxID=167968 RepID=UPI00263427C5|nr:hypothetical protein [uncultured Desulfovibrio sp.]
MAIPIPAVQRTRAVWALTLLRVVLDVYRDCGDGSPFGRQLRKVERWHRECELAVKQGDGNLSAGARRDLDARFAVVGPYIETEQMAPEVRAERWAALWWTALTELISARVICPDWCRGRCWGFLEQTVATMCERHILAMWPGSDVEGTRIALEIPEGAVCVKN